MALLLVIFLCAVAVGKTGGEEIYTLAEMCSSNTTTGKLLALVSSSTEAQQHPKCVCSMQKTSDEYVAITVKHFQCDSDNCPWKLKFYDNGCIREEFCCGKAPKDFSHKLPSSGHFMVAYEAQSGSSTNSSLRINFLGGITSQCGIADMTTRPNAYCTTTTTTTTTMTTPTTTPKTATKPTITTTSATSTEDTTTSVSRDNSTDVSAGATGDNKSTTKINLVLILAACTGALLVIIIVLVTVLILVLNRRRKHATNQIQQPADDLANGNAVEYAYVRNIPTHYDNTSTCNNIATDKPPPPAAKKSKKKKKTEEEDTDCGSNTQDIYSKPNKPRRSSHRSDAGNSRTDTKEEENVYSKPNLPPKSPHMSVDLTYATQIIDNEFQFIDNSLYSGQI